MSGKDNLLGAPTEGLGQTVTFQGQGVRLGQTPVVGVGGINVQGNQAGGQGLSITPVQQQAPDPTLALIAKAADSILAPRVKEEQQKAFFSGMQAVRQGQTVKQVIDSQPWYAQAFGNSAMVDGARAYAQQTQAQKAARSLMDNMEEHQKLSGDEFNALVNDTINSAMTGDEVTDAGILQSMTRTMPAVYSAQTRAHIKYMNEEMASQQLGTITSAGELFQKQAQELTVNSGDPSELADLKARFASTLVRPMGQSDQSYQSGLLQSILTMAQAGNFHAVNAAREVGAFDQLRPEDRIKAERAVTTFEKQARTSDAVEPYMNTVLSLRNLSRDELQGLDPAVIRDAYKNLNERYMSETGSREPLVPPNVVATEYATAEETLRQYNRARTAAMVHEANLRAAELKPQLKAQYERDVAEQMFASDNPVLTPDSELKKPAVDAMLNEKFGRVLSTIDQQSTQAAAVSFQRLGRMAAAGKDVGYIKDTLGVQWNQAVTSKDHDAFLKVYANYQRLKSVAPDQLGRFFSEDALSRLTAFETMAPDLAMPSAPGEKLNLTTGIVQAMSIATNPNQKPKYGTLSKEEKKAMISGVQSTFNSWVPFSPKLSDQGLSKIEAMVGPAIELYTSAGVSPDVATKYALSALQDRGGFVTRKYAWQDFTNRGKTLPGVLSDEYKKKYGKLPVLATDTVQGDADEVIGEATKDIGKIVDIIPRNGGIDMIAADGDKTTIRTLSYADMADMIVKNQAKAKSDKFFKIDKQGHNPMYPYGYPVTK